MANSTLNDLVQAIQRRGLSDLREETNQLGVAISTAPAKLTADTITLAPGNTLGNIITGAIIQIDYELMFVTGIGIAPNVPVLRGYQNSTPATHVNGSLITVNPRFPAVDIIEAINEDIDDLSAPTNGLFRMLEITLTFIPVVQGYDLSPLTDADVLEVWELRSWEYGPANKFPPAAPNMYRLQRHADTSIFPSGMSLALDESQFPGRPMRLQYKAPYATPLVNPTDDVYTVTGLQYQAQDIPILGALGRLMQFRELKRSFSEAQGEPRRAQEVPVGGSLTASKGLMGLREERIKAEAARLNKMYARTRGRW